MQVQLGAPRPQHRRQRTFANQRVAERQLRVAFVEQPFGEQGRRIEQLGRSIKRRNTASSKVSPSTLAA